MSDEINYSNELKNNPIHPIIFLSEESNCVNEALIDFPFKFMQEANLNIAKRGDELLLKMNNNNLRMFDNNNVNVACDHMIKYIKQESFTSFSSALLSSEFAKKGYYAAIPILEKVKENIDKCEAIERLCVSFYFKSDYTFTTAGMDKPSFEIDYRNTKSTVYIIAVQISEAISTAICIGADEAINDTMLQVHFVPSVKQLYESLSKENKDLKAAYNDNNYPILAATFLKYKVRDIVQLVLYNSILPGIINAFYNSCNTGYFIFDDYIYYDKNKINENADKNQ